VRTQQPPPDTGSSDLTAALDRLWPRYQSVLAGLVQIPSLSGAESEAQQYLAAAARETGLDAELWEVDPQRLSAEADYARADGCAERRPNLTAVLPGTGEGRSIAVSGHVDVVPVEPRHLWTRDPFGAEIAEGRMYGRGALDMKGGLVAGLCAIHAIKECYGALPGTVVFESVLEEECTGNGTFAARLRGPDIDAAIIPEITGEDVQIANPGVLWFEVTVTGKSAYVGLAGASVNAIEVATDLISAMRGLPAELNKSFSHPAYETYEQPLTLNAGTIKGGYWPSNVPLECVIGFRLAYPLDWTVPQAQQYVTNYIARVAADHPWLSNHAPTVRWHGFLAHGYSIEPAAPIVDLLSKVVAETTGEPARLSPMFGTADARYFGDRQIPAVYYGPAGGGMHSPDEWVDLASVRRVAHVLANTIVRWCTGG
jgi:acetylornithine deacetylase